MPRFLFHFISPFAFCTQRCGLKVSQSFSDGNLSLLNAELPSLAAKWAAAVRTAVICSTLPPLSVSVRAYRCLGRMLLRNEPMIGELLFRGSYLSWWCVVGDTMLPRFLLPCRHRALDDHMEIKGNNTADKRAKKDVLVEQEK
ncbi:unnamed protein product [Ceratitis capitata]|uniref:(Mediterranean fruit fly) hypothetical protein n=1 Tax=Ceratitis capitata TaxID=7213 RepID=A0A811ULQ4_CERCA|nr:unnamed protein product [Ceratitis capitata]